MIIDLSLKKCNCVSEQKGNQGQNGYSKSKQALISCITKCIQIALFNHCKEIILTLTKVSENALHLNLETDKAFLGLVMAVSCTIYYSVGTVV